MKDLIEKAVLMGRSAHGDQVRKYTGEPYFDTHCKSVANLVSKECDKVGIRGEDKRNMIVAALLHDVVEDTKVTIEEVIKRFNLEIGEMVYDLTDHFTPENYPHFNREQRKKLECDRLAACKFRVRLIKKCDIIDNSSDIEKIDSGFKHIFLREKERLLKALNV